MLVRWQKWYLAGKCTCHRFIFGRLRSCRKLVHVINKVSISYTVCLCAHPALWKMFALQNETANVRRCVTLWQSSVSVILKISLKGNTNCWNYWSWTLWADDCCFKWLWLLPLLKLLIKKMSEQNFCNSVVNSSRWYDTWRPANRHITCRWTCR